MQIQIGAILDGVFTDGPGQRTSVYTSGCSIRCPNCQNDQLFDKTFGESWDVDALADRLLAPGLPISILGGEPFDQAIAVASLVSKIKHDPRFVGPLIIYSGYLFEKTIARAFTPSPDWDSLANTAKRGIGYWADILVDGPFMGRNDDSFVQWRGSRNQRPINLAAMRAAGDMLTPIVLDWDSLVLTLTPDGDILGALGLIDELLAGMDVDADDARRCGQTQ